MLVLSRKPNQSIRIGNEITIKIVRVKGNTIQLGIEAPKEVPVVRSELLDKDAQSKKLSMGEHTVNKHTVDEKSVKENAHQQAQPKESGAGDPEGEAEKRPPLSLFVASSGDAYGTAI